MFLKKTTITILLILKNALFCFNYNENNEGDNLTSMIKRSLFCDQNENHQQNNDINCISNQPFLDELSKQGKEVFKKKYINPSMDNLKTHLETLHDPQKKIIIKPEVNHNKYTLRKELIEMLNDINICAMSRYTIKKKEKKKYTLFYINQLYLL
jgi:hypothetical protein